MNIATLNKIIEDFSHLPLDDKEYVVIFVSPVKEGFWKVL